MAQQCKMIGIVSIPPDHWRNTHDWQFIKNLNFRRLLEKVGGGECEATMGQIIFTGEGIKITSAMFYSMEEKRLSEIFSHASLCDNHYVMLSVIMVTKHH